MVTSLFSAFETSYSIGSLAYMAPMLFLYLFYSSCLWLKPHPFKLMTSMAQTKIKSELESMVNPDHKNLTSVLQALMMLILSINLIGILPYTFTNTTHISFTITLALAGWSLIMIYGWWLDANARLASLLPTGTPVALMPLMVLIESVSVLIRPLSLSVRLTANMITGHLLLSLIGGAAESGYFLSSMLGQSVLMGLELAVAVIQAYVFTVLMALYSKEAYAETNSILQE